MPQTNKNTTSGARARKRKTQDPLTPAMALAMLESAVSYCQQSGLKVGAANLTQNGAGTLGLFIPNAHYVLSDNGTRAAFRLGAFYQVRDDAPGVSAQAERAGCIGTSVAGISAQE